MDPQTIAIGVGICLLSAVLLYLVSVFGMREKTYEEVMEEQRQRQEELFLKARAEKKVGRKNKHKQRKGKGSEDDETPRKMVEIELDAEIINDTNRSATPPSKKSDKKAKKQKSILLNREEKSLVHPSLKAEETYHKPDIPRDVVQVKRDRERATRSESSDNAQTTPPSSDGEREKAPVALDRKKKEQVEEVKIAAEEPAMEPRKSKKSKAAVDGNADVGSVEGGRLLGAIQMAKLSDTDIQSLVELLLSKQTGGSSAPVEWTKKGGKGDPMLALRKQLEDKERVLQEEQSQSQAASLRVRALTEQLSTENQKFAILEKQSQEKVNARVQDVQALHARMQHTHEQHLVEVNQLRHQMEQMKSQLQQGDGGQQQQQQQQQASLIKGLREENQQLKETAHKAQQMAGNTADFNNMQQQLKIMSEEMSKHVVRLNASDSAKKTLEMKVGKYEDQIHKMESTQRDTESVLSRKLNEVSEQLRRAEGQNGSLSQEMERANKNAHRADQELANMRNHMKDLEGSRVYSQDAVRALEGKLEDAERIKEDWENRASAYQTSLNEFESKNLSRDNELRALKDENTNLITQLQTAKERTSGEGQEAPMVKAEVQLQEESIQRSDVVQKDEEIARLRDELGNMAGTLGAQRKKNDDLRRKNWKALNALSEMEKMAQNSSDSKRELESRESKIRSLTEELEAVRSRNHEVEAAAEQTLNQQLADLQKSYDALLAEKDNFVHIQSESQETAGKVADLESQLKAKAEETESLQKELSSLNGRNSRLAELEVEIKARVDEKEAFLQELEAAKQENERMGHFEAELRVKEEAVASLRSELDCLASQSPDADQLNTALKSKDDELESLKADVQSLRDASEKYSQVESELRTKSDILLSVQTQLEAAKSSEQDSEKAQKDRAEMAREVDLLRAERDTLLEKSGNVEQLKGDLKSRTEELESLQCRLQTLETLQADVENARKENEDLQSQLSTKATAATEAEDKIKQLTGEVEEKCSAYSTLQEEYNKMETSSVTQASGDSEQLVHMKSDLEAKINDLARIQNEFDALNRDHASLQEEKSQLETSKSAEIESGNTRLETANAEVARLRQERDELVQCRDQVEQFAVERSQLKEELLNKDRGLKELRQEVSLVKKDNHDLRQGCEQATVALTKAERSAEEIAQVQAELNAKVSEVSELRSAMEARDREIHELQEFKALTQTRLHAQEANGASNDTTSSVNGTSVRNEVTVLTKVQETCQWDMSRLVLDLDTREAELQILQGLLKSMDDEKTAALGKVQLQEDEMTSKDAELATLRQELDQQKQQADDRQRQEQLPTNVVELQREVDNKEVEMQKLRDIIKDYWKENNDMREKLDDLEATQEGGAGGALGGDTSELERRLESYQQQVDELRESASSQGNQSAGDEGQQAKATLHKLFPGIQISDTTTVHEEWVKEVEREVTAYIQKSTASSNADAELEDARQTQNKLQQQVQHYKTVLADTETILNKLQSSVESEEKKWQQKVQSSEDELEKTKQELKSLKEEPSSKDGTELEDRIQGLEERLAATESDKSDLQQQLSQEIARLKAELAESARKHQQLASTNGRLSGMLKTGQDALRLEQHLVEQLHEELSSKNKHLTNGTSSQQAVDELKGKLADTQRLLDQEMQANKQLSQKLASYGCFSGK